MDEDDNERLESVNNVVSPYFQSKQLLPFGFAEQYFFESFTVFTNVYPIPVYSPQKRKFNNNCRFNQGGYMEGVETLPTSCAGSP